MTRLLLAVVLPAIVTAGALAATSAFPQRIALPGGFQPEGIATVGERFYVGSIPTGAVYAGSLRTGSGALLVEGAAGRSAIGLKADRGRLFVAGGQTGMAYVYDARTGATVATYRLSTGGSFINDVAVTASAAWFTDSFKPVFYRVPLGSGGKPGSRTSVKTVRLTGAISYQSGFNVNGIAATPDGASLIVVQSNTGRLFAVDPGTGSTRAVDLGGESVPSGDGILLAGRRLYVVQNSLDRIAVVDLRADLRSGRVVRRLANPGLDVPTTVAAHGGRLYAVNARFGATASPSTEYWITQLRG
jgi:sugar lactone lactonase YvrE